MSLITLDRPLSQLLLRFVTPGVALGKFSLTLGKLSFDIGYTLLGIG